MAISILPATLEDADEMIEVSMAAFAKDRLSIAHNRLDRASPDQLAVWRRWRYVMMKVRMDGEGKYWFKAVDDTTGSIVGYAGLYAPGAAPVAATMASLPLPIFMNQEIEEDLRAMQKSAKAKHLDDRDDVWYVQSMAVDPTYQGQGIAPSLLQRGLDEADKAGQDVYLEGTISGQLLYRRCGFTDLGEMSLSTIDYKMMAMIRRPHGG